MVRVVVGDKTYTSDLFGYANGGCRVNVDANPFRGMISDTVPTILRFHEAVMIPGSTVGDSLSDTVCRRINEGLGEGWCTPTVGGIFMIAGAIVGLIFMSPFTVILGGLAGLALGTGLASGSFLIPVIVVILTLGCGALFRIFRR